MFWLECIREASVVEGGSDESGTTAWSAWHVKLLYVVAVGWGGHTGKWRTGSFIKTQSPNSLINLTVFWVLWASIETTTLCLYHGWDPQCNLGQMCEAQMTEFFFSHLCWHQRHLRVVNMTVLNPGRISLKQTCAWWRCAIYILSIVSWTNLLFVSRVNYCAIACPYSQPFYNTYNLFSIDSHARREKE